MSVCQTCGNKGWPQALVICNKCHTIAVHSYCQYKLPTNDEGEVTLACEFCEPRAIEQSDSTEMPGFSDVREFQDFQDIEHPRCLLTKESSSLSRGTEKSHNTIKQMHSSGEDSEDTQVETYHSDSAETSSESEEDIYGAVQPMHDPIWMGCFTIHGIYSCIVNEMLAHMSTEACEEASDVASLLPAILHLRMVPITDIWPVKFRKMQPTVHNISVYFFPENCRAERVYDHLVEDIIEHDLAMIGRVDGVELLVFSSRQLARDSWRFQRKYYLWGLFRRRKKTLTQSQGDNHPSSQQGSTACTGPSNTSA